MDARLVIPLLALVTLTSCSHYGWADRDEAVAGSSLHVETVSAAAHEGLDGGRLTRQLVDRLRLEGLDARWNGSAYATVRLRCGVFDATITGVEQSARGEATLACELVGADAPASWQARGAAVGSMKVAAPSALGSARASLLEAATFDAIDRLVIVMTDDPVLAASLEGHAPETAE